MNFIYYMIVLLSWYFFFWKVFVLFVTGWLTIYGANKFYQATAQGKKLSGFTVVLMHLYGTTVNCLIYGLNVAWATTYFGHVNPWFYYSLGGVIAFLMITPNGETSFLTMVESLLFYLIGACFFTIYPDWVGNYRIWICLVSGLTLVMMIISFIVINIREYERRM